MIEGLTYLDENENQLLGFMRIFGYFDASGNHEGKDWQGNESPAVIVAGFLSTPLKWQQFDKKWKQMLADANVTCFHASEFVPKKGEFSGWSKEQSDKFIAQALSIINGHVLHGVAMSLLREDYKRVVALHDKAVPLLFRSPYYFCTMRCWESGVDWARRYKYDDSIKYIFESGDAHQHDILKAHASTYSDHEAMKFWRFNVGELTFADGAKTTPLQAADFLAYAMYKEQYRLTYTPNEAQRPTIQTFLQIPGTYKYYVEEHLHEYIEEMIEMYRAGAKDQQAA